MVLSIASVRLVLYGQAIPLSVNPHFDGNIDATPCRRAAFQYDTDLVFVGHPFGPEKLSHRWHEAQEERTLTVVSVRVKEAGDHSGETKFVRAYVVEYVEPLC